MELRIPKLRKGSFFNGDPAPRRRIDQALYAVMMVAYVHEISTRAVDDLVEAMVVETARELEPGGHVPLGDPLAEVGVL